MQHQVWHQGKQKRWTPIVANNPKLHRSTVKVAGSHLMILIPANSNKSQSNVALSVKLHTTKRVQPVRSFRSGPEHKKIFRKNPNYSRVLKKNSECLACLNHCLTPERFCDVTCCPQMQRSQKGPINVVLCLSHQTAI